MPIYVIVKNGGGEVDRTFYGVTAAEIADGHTKRTGVHHRVVVIAPVIPVR